MCEGEGGGGDGGWRMKDEGLSPGELGMARGGVD